MTPIEIQLNLDPSVMTADEIAVLQGAIDARHQCGRFLAEEKYLEALERTVEALKFLREFPDFQNPEFRLLFVALLFDIAEIHYCLKNYKQSEKEVDVLFKVLENMVKTDEQRFARFNILAMELSTRILRSRKKALDLLVKQQIANGNLFEKVNAGITAASEKLIDSLCKTAQLLAATGNLRESLKFYAEAIRYSKKRTGRVTRKEVQMSLEMAEVMMRRKSMKPRARRLAEAILPHAVSLGDTTLEQDINSLLGVMNANEEPEKKWRLFLHKFTTAAKSKFKKSE